MTDERAVARTAAADEEQPERRARTKRSHEAASRYDGWIDTTTVAVEIGENGEFRC